MKEASSQLFLFAKDGKKRQPAGRSVVVVYARGSNTGHGIVVFSFLLSTTTFLFTTDLAAVREDPALRENSPFPNFRTFFSHS